jgi:hypothetical protein
MPRTFDKEFRLVKGRYCIEFSHTERMHPDFDAFVYGRPWLIRPGQKVEVVEGVVTANQDFFHTFPQAFALLGKARVLNLYISGDPFRLFSWTTRDGAICSWLCKPESGVTSDITLLPEHQLLLDAMGGIVDYANDPEDSFINNQNFLFVKSECARGLSWNEYYADMCAENSSCPMPVDSLISFAVEANGDETLYDLKTKQVYLFSHDPNADYVRLVKGQPENTFYHINGVANFVDYVELLAGQWLEYVQHSGEDRSFVRYGIQRLILLL